MGVMKTYCFIGMSGEGSSNGVFECLKVVKVKKKVRSNFQK